MIVALSFSLALVFFTPPEGELSVDPYEISNANAGAAPMRNDNAYKAFGGEDGIARVVDAFIEGVKDDPRTTKIFKASDFVRFRRTLIEQLCYLLAGPCGYTGQDMTKAHRDHGIATAEFNAVIEILQAAMRKEDVPHWAQLRLLAKLAPMHREVVTR